MFSSKSSSTSSTSEPAPDPALGLQLVAAVWLLFGWPGSGHAEDWLSVWPECAIGEGSRPELTLLYPAPGLPALVRAGEVLVVRIRTPAALTPPPGVQQPESLTNFMAELSAGAPALGPPLHQRHALSVLSLRPDGSSSLVYRVRVKLPAYLADGTYTLWLRTPFGIREAEQAVRVLGASATPRLRRLPAGMLLPPSAAATWPVDVWLAGSFAPQVQAPAPPAPGLPRLAVAPSLLAEGAATLALALRVGEELWVRSDCADARAFEREVANVLAEEGLRRVELSAVLERAAPPPSAAEMASGPQLSIDAGGAELDNRGRALPSELSLLLPFAPGVRASAGTLELFPASEPSAATPRAKLARWRVPAGVRARLSLTDVPARAQLELTPRGIQSGQPASLRVLGAGPGARVAYTLGFARSAYGTRELRTSFPGPLAHPVQAQVFDETGMGQVAHGHVWVEPYRPPTCAIRREARRTSGWLVWALGACVVLVRAARPAKKARTTGRSE